MADRLRRYRAKRDVARTPEPVPQAEPSPTVPPAEPRSADAKPADGDRLRFVIQQHHARRLHWDFRLERDGVLVSWAVPKGVPRDPEHNHLAVRTEDHPMEYLDFAGRIPEGEYGGGLVKIYDRGTYRVEKWRDDEVIVILDGERITGRHVLFHTRGDDWMIHRMDPPEAGWQPLPELTLPMRATRGSLPDTDGWGYEMRWDGVRAISRVSGGQVHLTDPDGEDITSGYPELRGLAEALAPVECVLDGEILGFRDGRPSADALERRSASRQGADQQRSGRSRRRASRGLPGETISYLAYDLLHADGESLLALGYAERRERLAALEVAGEHWQTPPYFPGNGAAAVATSQEQGLSGVVAKRLDSVYRPGKRTRDWLDVPVKRPRR